MKDRLLKRMTRWEESTETGYEEIDRNTLLDSIKDDLEKIYNTRRGTVLIDPDFGIPDFSYMLNGYSAPDVGYILQQMHLQAKKYEPRFNALQVKYIEQSKFPGKLQFQVTAKINSRDHEISFHANALLSDDGSIVLTA